MSAKTQTLGLIGGLGLEAGLYYYEHLAKEHAKLHVPLRMVLVHADIGKAMGHVIAGETDLLAEYLSGLIRQLAGGGADVAVIPAVTPHICIGAVEHASSLPIVNILQALSTDLQKRGVKRIALFGTRFVIESDLYGALPATIHVVRPASGEIARIDHLYRSYAVSGQGGEDERAEFTNIANTLCRRERLDAVILAGTDLSALFAYDPPDFPYVDASQVHIAAIMERLLRDSARNDTKS
ncbi:MAG TPA: aspartate/glutamate racemase family protein [Candidatus Baltobacteraceae bacterium]|nr:aspartate/glutamate racemase family protein [Candidatus Baltobacteraceae bacterium]